MRKEKEKATRLSWDDRIRPPARWALLAYGIETLEDPFSESDVQANDKIFMLQHIASADMESANAARRRRGPRARGCAGAPRRRAAARANRSRRRRGPPLLRFLAFPKANVNFQIGGGILKNTTSGFKCFCVWNL